MSLIFTIGFDDQTLKNLMNELKVNKISKVSEY